MLPRLRAQGGAGARATPSNLLRRTWPRRAGSHRNRRDPMTQDMNIEKAIEQVNAVLEGKLRAPHVKTFFHEPTFTATYVVSDAATRRAVIIDSVWDFEQPSGRPSRSDEHTSELQSLMSISSAAFCMKKNNHNTTPQYYEKQ